jgi:hypothetical protein
VRVLVIEDEQRLADNVAVGCAATDVQSMSRTTARTDFPKRSSPTSMSLCSTGIFRVFTAMMCAAHSRTRTRRPSPDADRREHEQGPVKIRGTAPDENTVLAGYENEFMQRMTLRWGRISSVLTLEDTQRFAAALPALAKAGIAEATAEPIRDSRST